MKIPKILSIFIGLAFLVSGAAFGDTIHVPDDYPTIKLAIEAAVDGDTVLVGPGTYCENDGEFLGKAITVKSEAGPDVTIIDMTGLCDLNFSGGETEETILEGFTILEILDISGNTSPTIKNCKLIGSGGGSSGSGHGSIWGGSSPTFINCQIVNGRAGIGGGYDIYDSSVTFINCEFSDNEADSNGGALYIQNSSVTLENCTFNQNSAGGEGGAIYVKGFPALSIKDCRFSENRAQVGGSIWNYWDTNVVVVNSIFEKNNAQKWGGAILNNASPSFTIENCIFTENNANWHGGAILVNWESSPTITNSIFSYNSAGGGGAIWIQPGSFSNITNCTFFKNSAGWKGGAILNSGSNPTITNSILWNDTAPEGPEIGKYVDDDPDPTVNHCDIQEGYPGNGNINADPLFVDPVNGNLHLQSGSPCIDAGTSEGAPNYDIDGDVRPQGSGYDIGADEFVPNQPPEAICQDVTLSTEPGLCSADASVDDGSFDPDGDEITFEQTPPGPYDLGDTDVTLTVTSYLLGNREPEQTLAPKSQDGASDPCS